MECRLTELHNRGAVRYEPEVIVDASAKSLQVVAACADLDDSHRETLAAAATFGLCAMQAWIPLTRETQVRASPVATLSRRTTTSALLVA
jgi:hypothetical protein